MKTANTLALLLLTLFLLSHNYSMAQNKVAVFVSQNEDLSLIIYNSDFQMGVSRKGTITGYTILANGKVSYDFDGRIKSVGTVELSYDFHGRIEKIGDERISFDFHNKLSQIGETRISYDSHNRVQNIGDQKISYDIHGRLEGINPL